jgi:hypothetical protein
MEKITSDPAFRFCRKGESGSRSGEYCQSRKMLREQRAKMLHQNRIRPSRKVARDVTGV